MKIKHSGSEPKNDTVLIESLFKETTRNGNHTIRLVVMALTRHALLIASSHSFGSPTMKSTQDNQSILEISSMHPLNSVKLIIFKKSERHTLKLCIHNKYYRYFELEKSRGSDELWDIWCKRVLLLAGKHVKNKSTKKSAEKGTSYDLNILKKQWEPQKFVWNDKYLYLGTKREIEDSSRPKPVPGLGPPEEIKFLYLKPQYFGCWDQTEHWVQCESSKLLKCTGSKLK